MNSTALVQFEAGQVEDLVTRLRGLIRSYPAGLGIAKEFIQNADDAGAMWVRFVLDLRTHDGSQLPDPRMAALMGPALLIESDQSFSEDDLAAIQRVGDGNKRSDTAKTGRFGLGFNTAYNVTDYPAFATVDRIVCFDPCRDAVASDGRPPGAAWPLSSLWTHTPEWPAAFGLEPGVAETDATVFRLPLRTEAQAHATRISSTPFTAAQVEQVLEEIAEAGPSLLLFLKSVMNVETVVIDPDGTERRLCSVKTLARDGVLKARRQMVRLCQGDVGSRIRGWSEAGRTSRVQSYEHRFSVRVGERRRTEVWRVVRGLVADAGGSVLECVQDMERIEERAIPLAGAAARLRLRTGADPLCEPSTGQVYCGLPLPEASGLPFHLDGHFDLDSSRSQLTHNAADVGNAAVRLRWNRVMMEHVVPVVVARLLRDIRPEAEPKAASGFYELFPDSASLRAPLFAGLAEAVSRELLAEPVLLLRVGASRWKWSAPSQGRLLPSGWTDDLAEAVAHDELAHAQPRPPRHIIEGLKRAGAPVRGLTAVEFGTWLRRCGVGPWRIERAPRHCLRSRSRIIELLRFCLPAGAAVLRGLPLALTAGDDLMAFRARAPIRLADDVVRAIFPSRLDWFLHPDVVKGADLKPLPGAGIVAADDGFVIQNLSTYAKPDADGLLAWLPDNDHPPNESWLLTVLDWLLEEGRAERHAKELSPIALIPGPGKRLSTPGHTLTPLLSDGETTPKLRRALEEIGVPLVEASRRLSSRLRRLADEQDGLIWRLRAPDVVDTLDSHWKAEAIPFADADARSAVLNWLAGAHTAEPFDSQRLAKLKSFQVWPSSDGTVRAAGDTTVFLATGFEPPSGVLDCLFFDAGPRGRWRQLLLDLGIPELTLDTFVEKRLASAVGTLSPDSRLAVACWLRDGGAAAIREHPKSLRLLDLVRREPILLGSDGRFHPGSELYHPRSRRARELLGEAVLVPDARTYEDEAESWSRLFEVLDLRRVPRLQDLVAALDSHLTDLGEVALRDAYCGRLLDFLVERWPQPTDVDRRFIEREFSTRAWIPALVERPVTVPACAFAPPEDRLYRPEELLPYSMAGLVGRVAPVLRRASDLPRELRDALGAPARASAVSVVAQLLSLADSWDSTGSHGQSVEAMTAATNRVYGELGARAGAQGGADDDSFDDALHALRSASCVWHRRSATFRRPDVCFSDPVPTLEPYCVQVSSDRRDIDEGLDLLGRRQAPTEDDLVRVLCEIGAGGGDPGRERQIALHIWSRLSVEPSQELLDLKLPMPTRAGDLRPISEVVIDDVPWWRDRLDGADSAWLDPKVDPVVAYAWECDRASEIISEVVIEHDPSDDPTLPSWCAGKQEQIESVEFRRGLLRILAAEREISPEDAQDIDLTEATSIEIRPCGSLVSELLLQRNPRSTPWRFGRAEVGVCLDESSRPPAVYVRDPDEEAVAAGLAQIIRRRIEIDDLSDGVLAPLEAILRCKTSQIESTLDRRRVPPLAWASEAVEEPEGLWQEEPPDWFPSDDPLDSDSVPPVQLSVDDDDAVSDGPGAMEPEPKPREAASTPSLPPKVTPASGAPVSPNPGGNSSPVPPSVPVTRSGTRAPQSGAVAGTLGTGGGANAGSGPQAPTVAPRPAANDGPVRGGDTSGGRLPVPGIPTSGAPWQGPASADAPPIRPGVGEPSARRTPRPRGRLRSYVEPQSSDPTASPSESRELAAGRRETEMGAVRAVMAAESAAGNRVVEMPPGNPGFDLQVFVPGTEDPSIIEVKGLRDAWGLSGVGLTPTEFAAAQRFGDRYWLYVVEFAREPERATIYRIRNPANRADEFRFDSGWAAAAERSGPGTTDAPTPVEGMDLCDTDGAPIGVIRRVTPFGALVKLDLDLPDGGSQTLVFSAAKHRLRAPSASVPWPG